MREARIWSYARALGKAMIEVAPKDFRMEWNGANVIKISCTIANLHEAEAVCEIIMHTAQSSLSSQRPMVRGDIYPEKPKPTFAQELESVFGPSIYLIPKAEADG